MRLPFERKNIFNLLYLLIIPALLFSKGLLSICSVILTLLAIFSYERDAQCYLGIHPLLKDFREFGKRLFPFMGITCLFLWMVISGIWSEDMNTYDREINAKLLMLLIPIQFALAPRLSSRAIVHIHYFLYAVLGICCVLVIGVYLSDMTAINESIKRGKSVPTPIDHIRFSMMLAYACLSIIAFFIKKIKRTKLENYGLIFASLFFFTMLHILAVRTGLALLYSGFCFLLGYLIFKEKRYVLGGIMLAAVIFTPIAAYMTVPTIQNKVRYTLMDYSIWSKNNEVKESYSDNDRMLSMQIGLKIWSQNWILGVGGGDYNALTEKEYNEHYPLRRQLLPHNQYIRTGLGYGIVGVLLLVLSLLLPFRWKSTRQNLLFIVFILLYALSFMVESNLERYYSLGFFLYFFGWTMMYDGRN